ncbi:MAG: hypothetical protein D6719_08325 [Candidatus Dadabacteria bacterium]|nr:MAG: hypothetical protein D6719_08325 [Candidatus Dadabacteria bacterium]
MSFEKLQIKELSASGQLLNCINCFAGQVTVLRAVSASALAPYQRALSGVTAAERFSITLDGKQYSPADHVLVGFGESFHGDNTTLEDYMASGGVPAGNIESLLISYGLIEVSNKPLSSLTSCQQRRARILNALYQPNKVIVLNNPFEPLSSKWRERFAELVVNHARSHKTIVVVPSLSVRPECWIDNEYIARIQVGETLQKTIGFGQSEAGSEDLVHKMREILADEKKVKEILSQSLDMDSAGDQDTSSASLTEQPPPASGRLIKSPNEHFEQKRQLHVPDSSSIRSIFYKPSSIRPAFYALVVVAVLIVAALVANRSGDKSSIALLNKKSEATITGQNRPKPEKSEFPKSIAKNFKTPPAVKNPVKQQVNQSKSAVNKPVPVKVPAVTVSKPKVSTGAQQPFIKRPATVLDSYPAEIKNSILAAFKGQNDPGRIRHTFPPAKNRLPAPEKETAKAADSGKGLLKLLEAANGTGKNSPPVYNRYGRTPTGSISTPRLPADVEARREQIRRKFLEAVERAAQRRQAMGQ